MVDNSTAVQQMRDSVKNMNLFRSIDGGTYDFKIIHDFEQANFYAFEMMDFEGEMEGMTWTDIRERQSSKVLGLLYKEPDYKRYFKEILDMAVPEADEITYSEEALSIEDEIYEDLCLCIRCRRICGYRNIFFEGMFKIYELGGWPCGWEGKLTEGRFIAYFPLDEDAEE